MKNYIQNILTLTISHLFGLFLFVGNKIKIPTIIKLFRLGLWRARNLRFGDDCVICGSVVIKNPEKVKIGNRAVIGEFIHIWGGGGIEIGNDTMIASHSVITSQTHLINGNLFRETIEYKPVIIGNNVWIGAGSIILPGVVIGDNCVIGAGSVVSKSIPTGFVVAGVPARALRSIR